MAKGRRKGTIYRILVEFGLPLLILLVAFWFLLSVYVAYRVMHPKADSRAIDPAAFLLPYKEFHWTGTGGLELHGWFIAANPTAPVVFLCHGYASNRGRTLGLAERLRAEGLSTAVLGLRGHEGSVGGTSTLGWWEGKDLLLARDQLRQDKFLEHQKLGAWGADVGAYAALTAASEDAEFRAVAADTPADSVEELLASQTESYLGTRNGFLLWPTRRALALASGAGLFGALPRIDPLRFANTQVLLLVSEQDAARARRCEVFGETLAGHPQILKLVKTRVDELDGAAQEDYDRKVATFFRAVHW